jgi:hypothetical protein
MRGLEFRRLRNKLFLSICLFSIVFLFFAWSVKELWFKLDDIGTIIDGMITSVKDFLYVFSTQSRDFTAPINYKFSKPNFISALYRPLINIPFTITYYLAGLNAYVFYLVNVLFHALNTVLLFYIFLYFMPLTFSFLGSLLFAFYRDMSWLTWIAILNNVLSTFLLFVTILLFLSCIRNKEICTSTYKYYLSGFTLLLSFLSRESSVFFGFWIFFGVFLFSTHLVTCMQKLRFAFSKTWIFFLSNVLYILIRIWAFGFETISRTVNNFFIRFPFLKYFLQDKTNKIVIEKATKIEQQSLVVSDIAKTVVKAKPSSIHVFSNNIVEKICAWLKSLFHVDIVSGQDKILYLGLFVFWVGFLLFAYRKNKRLLLFLFLGFCFFGWPGFLAYPNTRYISSIFPIVIFTFLFGIYLFFRDDIHYVLKRVVLFVLFLLVAMSLLHGVRKNVRGLQMTAHDTLVRKAKYEKFFGENSFDKHANFIVISSPFTSDIHSVFQYFLGDWNIKLSYVLFATLAHRGSMGCKGDYKILGVKNKIIPVQQDGKKGLRLISLDKDHCAWWMNFSYYPIKWSKDQQSYIWKESSYEVGRWYDFSMGKFIIHERIGKDYVTDITFLFDDKWINEYTVFVYWDTVEGKYKILKNVEYL